MGKLQGSSVNITIGQRIGASVMAPWLVSSNSVSSTPGTSDNTEAPTDVHGAGRQVKGGSNEQFKLIVITQSRLVWSPTPRV